MTQWARLLAVSIVSSLVAISSESVANAHEFPKVTVQVAEGGCPQLYINARLTPPLFLFVNIINIDDPINRTQSADEIRLAAASGIHLVVFQFGGAQMANSASSFDYKALDRILGFILANDPQAYILIRVLTGGGDFARTHPSQMITYANGTHPSLSVASKSYLVASAQGMTTFVERLRQSAFAERIIGLHIMGGSRAYEIENFPMDYWHRPGFDYSEPNRAAFDEWLKSGGKNVLERNVDPRSVEIPLPSSAGGDRSPIYGSAELRYVDYLNYQSDIAAKRIEVLAAAARKASSGRLLLISFYGYGFELPTPDSSHLAIDTLLRDRSLDSIGSPFSYADRGPGGSPAFMGPVDSAVLHRKFWLIEDDTRTFRTFMNLPTDKWLFTRFSRHTSDCKDLAELIAVHRRNFGMMMIHREATWWMDLAGSGWLNDADIWKNLDELRAAYVKYAPRTPFKPDVAVIYDPRSSAWARVGKKYLPLLGSLLLNPTEYSHCGASVGFYTLSDLRQANFPAAKVVIFLNAWHIDDAMRRLIQRKLQRDGRTLVWIYGAGFISDDGRISTEASSRLIGINLRLRDPSDVAGSEVIAPNALGLEVRNIAGLDAIATKLGSEQGLKFEEASNTPSFAVNDLSTITLARYDDTGEVSVALKHFPGYQSLFIGETRPSGAFWRDLFPHFGVPVYLDSDDAFETDGRLVMISGDGNAGMRTLRLPKPGSIYDLLSGQKLASDTRNFPFVLERNDTKLWRIVPTREK